MNRTNLLRRGRNWLARVVAVAMLVTGSLAAFGQASFNNLVDLDEATVRLSQHYSAQQATLDNMTEKSANYEEQLVRTEFAMHLYEDFQGASSSASVPALIAARLPESATASSGATSANSFTANGGAASIDSPNTLVSEVLQLLQR